VPPLNNAAALRRQPAIPPRHTTQHKAEQLPGNRRSGRLVRRGAHCITTAAEPQRAAAAVSSPACALGANRPTPGGSGRDAAAAASAIVVSSGAPLSDRACGGRPRGARWGGRGVGGRSYLVPEEVEELRGSGQLCWHGGQMYQGGGSLRSLELAAEETLDSLWPHGAVRRGGSRFVHPAHYVGHVQSLSEQCL
jgi:hypothetical protein